MIRIVFTVVLAVHAAIHLIGFSAEWKLIANEKFVSRVHVMFTEGTSKIIGTLWLIACVLLLLATLAYYTQKTWFWIPASAGLILSQTLIVIYWQDAKWGTIVNVVMLILIILSIGSLRFKKLASTEIANLINIASDDRYEITEDMLTELPGVVQTWLRNAHIIGSYMPSSVYVRQKGSMRTSVDSEWLPFDAEQTFTIDPPGFVWTANIHTRFMIDIVGRDKFENGKGNMLIKAASLLPIANSSGKEIDQGTMIRYLAELAWFPQAALSDYLDWEEIDPRHARVVMNYRDVSVSGIYTFNDNGMPIGFEAQRYGEFNGKFSTETWSVKTTAFAYFDGLPIGNASEVTWKLREGDFTWLKLTLTEVAYD